jgi:hypothetical protein
MDSARVRTCLDGVCVPCAQRAPRRGKREGFDACLTFAPDGGPPAVLIGTQSEHDCGRPHRYWRRSSVLGGSSSGRTNPMAGSVTQIVDARESPPHQHGVGRPGSLAKVNDELGPGRAAGDG